MVSCPQGKEYHERLKAAFPNLSKTIMDLLADELEKAEKQNRVQTHKEVWLKDTVLPVARGLLGKRDPWDMENKEMIEMLKPDITLNENEADWILNKLMNEMV
jgi:hypothetical protein